MAATEDKTCKSERLDYMPRGDSSHRLELLRGTKWMRVHKHFTEMSSLILGQRLLL